MTDENTSKIHEEVKAIMQKEGLSQAKTARLADVPPSTFAAWLNGSYNGDNLAVSKKIEKWINAKKETVAYNDKAPEMPKFFKTPSSDRFLEVLSFAQTMPEIAIIAGGAGIGKTTAAKHYLTTHSNVWLATMNPSTARPWSGMLCVAQAMGVERKGRASDIFNHILSHVRGRKGLLIIDESQHLHAETIDLLRSLYDQAEDDLGLALVGNQSVFARIQGGVRHADFAQLYSRVGFKVKQDTPKDGDMDALIAAWGVKDDDAVKRLKAIGKKHGALRGLTKCLQLASMLARGANRPLDEAFIKAAWSKVSA